MSGSTIVELAVARVGLQMKVPVREREFLAEFFGALVVHVKNYFMFTHCTRASDAVIIVFICEGCCSPYLGCPPPLPSPPPRRPRE